MYRVVCQVVAEDRIVRVCWKRADHVAGLDHLDRHHRVVPEVLLNGPLQELADVAVAHVPGGVPLLTGVSHEFLTDPLRDHNHRVRVLANLPLLLKHPSHALQQALFPPKGERDLRNQHEVHIRACQRGVGCDESGITPHELDDHDPVVRSVRLDVCGLNRLDGLGEGGLEAKGLCTKRDVVVDGLRDADHADLQLPAGDLFCNRVSPTEGPVASDGEEDPDVVALQAVHDLCRILWAS